MAKDLVLIQLCERADNPRCSELRNDSNNFILSVLFVRYCACTCNCNMWGELKESTLI